MKGIAASLTRPLTTRSKLKCADNSGAKIIEIIAVKGFKGRRKMKPSASVGSLVWCKIYSGSEKVMHEVHRAVVIRQKKEYRRADGTRIGFEDNAAVLVDDKGETKGTQIKGPVAKEAVERFPSVGKIASIVV